MTPLNHMTNPSDWNKPHDALFDQNMGGIKQTCGINQPCGQYCTREYFQPIAIQCFQALTFHKFIFL